MKRKMYTLMHAAIFFVLVCCISITGRAQVPTCDPSVPFYQVNLTGHPDSIWYSPGHSRSGNCCGTVSPDRCTSFEVILDTGAAMINFNIASGAIPTGSMFYQIGCSSPTPVGQPICIVGPGPHHVTFCKPGNNQNTYMIQSIPKPLFPKTQHVRIGCHQNIKVLGLDTSTVTWTSIYPGTQGQYNSYLSCTSGCINPLYTPATNAPSYIIYKICGTPIATACGYLALCDTFRVYNHQALTATVSPNPAGFCASGSGVTLTASASGGYGAYTYTWRNQSNVVVGTGSTYLATTAGTYACEVRDALYNVSSCPSTFVSVPVTVTNVPVVNAGADQTLCHTSPTAYLNGSVQYATGGIWSGGAGTYNPSNTNLNAAYTPSAAELTAGSVTLTLTSTGAGGGCTNATDQVVLYYPPQLNVALSTVTVSCNNDVTILTPTVTGGTAPYSYVWNTGSNNPAIMVGAGNYCVSVTDNIGCNSNLCANVVAPSALALTMSSTNVTTNGGSNGTATANPSGGTPPYAYSWSPGAQTTQTASGLSFGVYTVTVTDSKGCSIYSSIVVNEPRCAAFTGSISKNNALCFGDLSGSATVNASGGTAPYTYNWNDPLNQTTATASGLGAGTYIVVVSDANGCLYASGTVISEPSALNNVMNQTNVTVIGASTGVATANPSGGVPAYVYNWSNGGTTQTISSLVAGTYILNLSDNNNCHLIDSVTITQPPCQNLTVAATTTDVSCFGGNNGSATVVALHGTAPYTYSWSNGAATSTVPNLSAGTYVVTITDASNCTNFKNVIIAEPSPLSIGLAPTPISCNDKNDGTIELTVSGGTFPYTFNWSNGITVEDLINLSDASYSVTVTDNKGCVATGSTTITRPTRVAITETHSNVTCNAGSNGAIDISVTGGVLPYSYAWTNGSTSQDVSGLTSGQYNVVVTDANGCNMTTPLGILIDQPDAVAVLSQTVSCPAPGSGVALVNVTPGGGWQSPYQVSFDNGASYQTAGTYSMLLPVNATYTVLVKDNNNCLSPVAAVLTIDPEVSVSATSYYQCFYGATTTTQVTVTPNGGDGGPYAVSLDGGTTYQTSGTYQFTLPVDSTYAVIVKDTKGCISVNASINLPPVFSNASQTSNFNTFNISCNGLSDGTITLTTSGGTTPYAYTWSNGSSNPIQTSLGAGSYSVIVSDANNCKDTLNFVLTQPTALTSNASATTNFNGYNISCNGLSDAGVDLTVSGGVTTYGYQWSNGISTEDLSAIPAGTYSVIVTDANNCKDTTSITITEPTVLNANISITTNFNGYNISCFGLSDGALNLQVTGGVQTYGFNWSNGSTSQNLSAISAGSYSVIVTDQNNCKDTANVTLTQPTDLLSSIVSISIYNGYGISCNGLSDGSIDITVSGGVTNYTYAWSNSTTTQDQSSIGAGTYSVIITDANNCKDTLSTTITEPAALTSTAVATSNFNGYQISCAGLSDGSIGLTVSGGVSAYGYQWSNGSTSQNLSGVPAGSYSVIVTDANNCQTTANVMLAQPSALTSSLTVTSNYNGYGIRCYGMSDGSIYLQPNGGVPTYSYSWSNGNTTQNLSAIPAGSYSVIVTDQNNCTATASITVTQPSDLISSIVSVSNYNGYGISCAGLSNGSIDINVTGGVAAYTYAWSDGMILQDESNIAAGTYSVVITDANNCKDTLSATLTEPSPLTATGSISTNYNGYPVSCFGSADAGINTTVNGGVPVYTYMWSNGTTTQNLTNVGAGAYSVTVTDLNACTYTMSFNVSQPAAVAVSASIQNVLCNGFQNGSVDQTVSGGVSPYQFGWSNSTSAEDLSNVGSGIYTVTVTDLNGCASQYSYTITETSPIVVSVTQKDVTCNGFANGNSAIVVSGGTPAYIYQWSNGATSPAISNVGPGVYTFTVTDVNNCTHTATVTINEPAVLSGSLNSPVLNNGHNVSFYNSTDGSISSSISGGTTPYQYNWSNGATTANLNGIGAGSYTVTVTDNNGCTYKATIALTAPLELEMPTGISPNGDGLNDFFVVHGLEAYPNNSFTVFNRWGNKVFDKDKYQNDWYGKNNSGADLPDGTYFVVLKINNGDITLTGYVDVRR